MANVVDELLGGTCLEGDLAGQMGSGRAYLTFIIVATAIIKFILNYLWLSFEYIQGQQCFLGLIFGGHDFEEWLLRQWC